VTLSIKTQLLGRAVCEDDLVSFDDEERYCANLLSELRPLLVEPTDDSPARFNAAYQHLKTLAASKATPQRIEVLLVVAQYYYLAAKPSVALEAATEAEALARRSNDRRLLRWSLSLLGLMQSETGNLPGATASLSEALEIARELQDRTAEGRAWVNLGVSLIAAAQYSDSITSFERAIALSGADAAGAQMRRNALTNIGLCALHLGDVRTGLRALNAEFHDAGVPQTAADATARASAESVYARLLLDVGDVDGARRHAEEARKFAQISATARAQLVAATASGLVEVHSGSADIGLTRLKQTLEQSRQGLKGEVRDTLSACIAGYEAAGQPDVALVYLHELLAMNREAKAAQVLMHHKQHVARLEQPAFAPGSIDVAMANHRGKLRIQLGERELMRNRILLLEQQSVAAELHDDTTGEHCYRVGRLASILGKEIGLEDDVCFLIDLAARLHDIGKLVVPDAILLKPGKLTPGEREIMETHTTAGAEILAKSNVPQMHIAEEIARHHHERWDGTGYPMKLGGSAIPIAARVSALADVFDALTHKRPYKEAWKVSDALAEIRSLKSRQFDPELTDIFLDLVPRLQREHGDLDEFLAVEAKNSPFIKARKQIAEALKGQDPETSLFEMRR